MILNTSRLKKRCGYYEGNSDTAPIEYGNKAKGYKRRISGLFSAINQHQLESRLGGNEFFVTRKIDGEMQVLFYSEESAFLVNGNGKIRAGLPCIDEAGAVLKNAGIKNAAIPAELHCDETNGRTRVYDVLEALGDGDTCTNLRLAPFDIIEIDGINPWVNGYNEVYQRLNELFSNKNLIAPVPMEKVGSIKEVQSLFEKWVVDGNAEGLVVHSSLSRVFKVKQKHTVDGVVVGYTEGDDEQKGKIRDLLVAVMDNDGHYRVVAHVGNGYSEDVKAELFQKFSVCHCESQYVETDSRNVAFHMVKPETIVEIGCNDLLTETSKGVIRNSIVTFDGNEFSLQSMAPGVALIYPVFERIRTDKPLAPESIHLHQLTDIVPIAEGSTLASLDQLPHSEILIRDVYVKEMKGKTMVQKYIVLKTNKDDKDSRFPAYVFHYSDFSSGRKDALKRDIRVSSSQEQIMEIAQLWIDKNVKKGWNKVESAAAVA